MDCKAVGYGFKKIRILYKQTENMGLRTVSLKIAGWGLTASVAVNLLSIDPGAK